MKTQADFAVTIPDTMNDFTAAQMYINPITAFVTCSEVLNLQSNDVLLVNACGSAIGHLYAQLAKLLGYQLIAVTRSNQHTEELLQLGAAFVIDTSHMPLYETVMALTNGREQIAIDSIGGEAGNQLAFCVKPEGIFSYWSFIGYSGKLDKHCEGSKGTSEDVSFTPLATSDVN